MGIWVFHLVSKDSAPNRIQAPRRRAQTDMARTKQPTAQGAKEGKNHDSPTKFELSTD